MAQRTGAKRFLASPAKTASARVILALAVAVLLLAGCGGGSSEGTSTTSSSSSSTSSASKSASAEETSPGATGGSKAAGKAGEGDASQGGKGAGSGSSHSSASGQGHAPIAPPKGPAEQAPSPEQVAHATVADMSLQSPAIIAAQGAPGRLAATYTCDGANSWPALHWGGVPPGTAELILYAMNVQPVDGQLFVDWALGGLSPNLSEIQGGELPKGAVVGKNGFGKLGYSLCPQGNGEIYMFALYALPQSLSLNRGFDAREVRKQILDVSRNVGLLPAVYERG